MIQCMKQLLAVLFLSVAPMLAAESTSPAVNAINALGIDLLHQAGKPAANALLSPYSIQTSLAVTYAGAADQTRVEMARVLHYPKDDAEVHRSFAALRKTLDDIMQRSVRETEAIRKYGGSMDPITLITVNRLFGQTGYAFREPFLELVKGYYDAPLETLNFKMDPADATKHINAWVEEQTRQRIRSLIPAGTLNEATRLVLVNAIYLKAPWADEFSESATQPRPFHPGGHDSVMVPTMRTQRSLGYARRAGYTALTIPYYGGDLQFLILFPDKVDGLAELEQKATAGLLSDGAQLGQKDVILYLPKFKLEPPTLSLGKELQTLGMKTAFDIPQGSANFDGLAPREPDNYLCISAVFQKAFLSLDEKGTEAAAATALAMRLGSAMSRERPRPVEVRVDHPFLFAIQHRPSGACLFLGHVSDPR